MNSTGPNPNGMCMCGCGQPAPLARTTDRRFGLVAGYPTRYIAAHRSANGRKPPFVFGQKATGRWFVKGRDRKPHTWARIVMQNTLGRELRSNEHVHHINGDKTDDRPENLAIVSREEHPRLHPEAGHASWAVRRGGVMEYRREVQRRYLAGQSLKEIGAAFGIKDISATLRRMRDDGWDLPHRHRGWAKRSVA